MNLRSTNAAESGQGRSLEAWLGPAVLGLLALVCGLFGEFGRLELRYDRVGVAEGDAWRLVTGHLVHLGFGHLAMNLAALGVLGALFMSSMRRWDWLGTSVTAALAIDAGLYWLHDSVAWYVGLSGVLHGLWAVGALKSLKEHRLSAVLLLTMLVGKLVWEQSAGPLPFSEGTAGGAVIIEAHLYGASGGLIWFVLDHSVRRSRGRPL